MTIELHPNQIPEDLKKYFRPKLKNGNWILRNSIIWHKKNCMPSSAKNRYTIDYERILFFTKSKKYYFKTQYEPIQSEFSSRPRDRSKEQSNNGYPLGDRFSKGLRIWGTSTGRIKRCVWTINTKPFSEAHFAVFPPALVEQCLDAGCPSEICKKCGKSRINIYESKTLERYELPKDDPRYRPARYDKKYPDKGMRYADVKDLGLSDCGCNAGFESGIVLDPFMGSGTTALVALKYGRSFLGIELNKDYIEIANKRLERYLYQEKLPIYNIE